MLIKKNASPLQAAVSAVLSLVVIGGLNKKCWKKGHANQFKEITAIPDDLYSCHQSICLYEGVGLILTGGSKSKVCAVYHVVTKMWQKIKILSTPREGHASVCIRGQLLVIGGDLECGDNWKWSSSMERLNMKEEHGEWQPAPQTPAILTRPKVASLDTDVFLMGDKHTRLYNFDGKRNVWSQRAALPQDPGQGFSMCAGNGQIYAAGGFNKITCIYNPSSDCWTHARQPALKSHHYGALVFHEDRLVLLGGNSDAIEEYDAEKDSWQTALYKLPCKLYLHFAFSTDMAE